jgi:hypothetical protein
MERPARPPASIGRGRVGGQHLLHVLSDRLANQAILHRVDGSASCRAYSAHCSTSAGVAAVSLARDIAVST